MNIKINNKLILSLLLVVMLTVASSISAQGVFEVTTSADAYKDYSDAYIEYRNAVSEQRAEAEIKAAFENYSNARDAYIQLVNQEHASIEPPPSFEPPVIDDMPVPAAQQTSAASAPSVRGNIDSVSFREALPSQVADLIDALKRVESKEEALALLKELNKFLPNQNAFGNAAIRYEMAIALDRFDINKNQARQMFEELGKRTDIGSIANLAKMRLNQAKSQILRAQWTQALNNSFASMTDAFNKYKNTSWINLPMKLVRGATYLKKQVEFVKAQNDEADFMLWYEATNAPFVPSVGEVFEEYRRQLELPPGNYADVALIYNNYESWYARWKLISEARHSIDVQYFIIDDDAFGISFMGLLKKKAEEGVKIRLMTDVRGSFKMVLPLMARGYLQELARLDNFDVKVYNPIQSNLVSVFTDIRRVISSNHDKIVVIDGRYSIIGGRNVGKEYFTDAKDTGDTAWRDTDLVIDCEIVNKKLQRAFSEEFDTLKSYEVGKSLIRTTAHRLRQLEVAYALMEAALNRKSLDSLAEYARDSQTIYKRLSEELNGYRHMNGYPEYNPFGNIFRCPVQIYDSHSLSGPRNDITEAIVRYVDASREEVLIQNPYVAMTPRAEEALKRAGRRGVPIRIHTNSPQTSDSFPTEAMLVREWRDLLTNIPTLRIHATVNEGQLHGKNFVFDTEVGVVGTYNLDFLSERVNSEVIAAVRDFEFAAALRQEIMDDISRTVEYTLATADAPEFGPEDVEGGKMMWLVKLISKMGWLKPLF